MEQQFVIVGFDKGLSKELPLLSLTRSSKRFRIRAMSDDRGNLREIPLIYEVPNARTRPPIFVFPKDHDRKGKWNVYASFLMLTPLRGAWAFVLGGILYYSRSDPSDWRPNGLIYATGSVVYQSKGILDELAEAKPKRRTSTK